MKRAFTKILLNTITRIGAKADEDDDARLRRILFIGASLAGVPSYALYGVLYAVLGAPLAAD